MISLTVTVDDTYKHVHWHLLHFIMVGRHFLMYKILSSFQQYTQSTRLGVTGNTISQYIVESGNVDQGH